MCAWILRGICGRPVIYSLDFSLLGSCSLELLLLVVNLEMDNSLKWILFNIVSGQITPLISPALVEWKAQANVNGLNFICHFFQQHLQVYTSLFRDTRHVSPLAKLDKHPHKICINEQQFCSTITNNTRL